MGMVKRWTGRAAVLAAVLAAVALVGGRADAQPMTFAAFLTNEQETPNPAAPLINELTGGPRPKSWGLALFSLNAAQTELTMTTTVYNIDVTGSQTAYINDDLVAAHIHASAGAPSAAGTRPVVWGFFGAPDNDNNPDNLVVLPFAPGVGGLFTSVWNQPEGNNGTTLTAQLPNIIAGRSYINFHTRQFGGGEIRGALFVTPEPSTYALMATGLGVVGMVAWRRRRVA